MDNLIYVVVLLLVVIIALCIVLKRALVILKQERFERKKIEKRNNFLWSHIKMLETHINDPSLYFINMYKKFGG